MLYLTQSLIQLAIQVKGTSKSKSELIIPGTSATSKIETAIKEGKRIIYYQYALLDEDQIKKLK